MNNKHVIGALPLMAAILGRKYGVEVRIGGDDAYTNGKVIQLPSMPIDGGKTLLGLARGYCDHESAHIRHTDFDALKRANLTPLEHSIWNCLEDWRVENALAALYPGCQDNFHWLVRHLFCQGHRFNGQPKPHVEPAMLIPEWILLTVRSWDVPELQAQVATVRKTIDGHYPGLVQAITAVLDQVQQHCPDTDTTIAYTKEIVRIIGHQATQEQQAGATMSISGSNGGQPQGGSVDSLEKLLMASSDTLPAGMGSQLEKLLGGQPRNPQDKPIQVAVISPKTVNPLSAQDVDATRRATTALRTRMQSFLQSQRFTRSGNSYHGKIDQRKLHTLTTGNARIFQKRNVRPGLNTAIHILLDSSGSMNGKPMEIAGQAAFAVASALSNRKGISIGVSTFPGSLKRDRKGSVITMKTVSPILAHNQNMHTDFRLEACGSTPMDAALWWVLQVMHPLPEPRKIVLIITDGEPDLPDATKIALKALHEHGLEVYGIGIQTQAVKELLPASRVCVISDINELAQAMFGMLHQALVPITS